MTTKFGNSRRYGDVEDAVMRRAVRAGQAGAVEAERHRQVLQGHFLEDLVEGPLQERRIDVDDRPHARLGQAGGEGDGVRFADADVEEAVGEVASRTFSSLLPWHMAAVMTATRGSSCIAW